MDITNQEQDQCLVQPRSQGFSLGDLERTFQITKGKALGTRLCLVYRYSTRAFSRALSRFPALGTRASCFPVLGTGCTFSALGHVIYVFPRFARVACFSALCKGSMFFRAWHRLLVAALTSAWFNALFAWAPDRQSLNNHLLMIVAIISKQISWLFWNSLTKGKDRRAR